MRNQKKKIDGKIESYFSYAKDVAQNSSHDTFWHGAVLVKGGSVISKSANYDRYLSFADRFRKYDEWYGTYHAEVGCIYNLNKSKTEGSRLYVVRINPNGKFRNSEPCEMCKRALEFMGVREVVYSVDHYNAEKLVLL